MATRTRQARRQTSACANGNGLGVADLATGAIVGVADAATHPLQTLRNQARQLRRRGQPVNEDLVKDAGAAGEQFAETGEEVASGRLAERIALQGVRLVKQQARR